MSDELLRCPFCGGTPDAHSCIVECANPDCWAQPSISCGTSDESVAAWNRRAVGQEDAEVLDARRYRWLRAEHQRDDPIAAVVWKPNGRGTPGEWVNTTDLDREIDDAMPWCGTGCACLTDCGDYYESNGLPKPPERTKP